MPPKPKPVEERFWPKVNKTDTCWLWTACVVKAGYGRFLNDEGKVEGAHVVAYRMLAGPLQPGDKVDHRCHVKNCVRPEHLRRVTHKENMEHRNGPTKRSKSGVRGVSWNKARNLWVVFVQHNGKNINCGGYSDLEEAKLVAVSKRNELFTHNDKDK